MLNKRFLFFFDTDKGYTSKEPDNHSYRKCEGREFRNCDTVIAELNMADRICSGCNEGFVTERFRGRVIDIRIPPIRCFHDDYINSEERVPVKTGGTGESNSDRIISNGWLIRVSCRAGTK